MKYLKNYNYVHPHLDLIQEGCGGCICVDDDVVEYLEKHEAVSQADVNSVRSRPRTVGRRLLEAQTCLRAANVMKSRV